MKPLISVIVPVYNNEDYLYKCVNSIQNQTITNIEIILVNDGSTDNSAVICDNLELSDSRIKVIHKENGGAAEARNIGIDNARGRYIGFVDSDDYIEPYMYEKLLKVLEENKIEMVDCLAKAVNPNELHLKTHNCDTGNTIFQSKEDAIKDALLCIGNISFCTRLFKREVFDNYRFPIGRRNEDFILMLYLYDKIEKNAILKSTMYYYVQKRNSVTRSGFGKTTEDAVYYAKEAMDFISYKYPQLKLVAERFYYNAIMVFFINIPNDRINEYKEIFNELLIFIRKSIFRILLNKYLSLKHKTILAVACVFPKYVNRLFLFKKKLIPLCEIRKLHY